MSGLRRRREPLRPLDRFGFRGQQNNGLGCLLGIYRLNLSCGKVTGGPGVASLDVYIIYRRFQQRLPQAKCTYLLVESLRRFFLGGTSLLGRVTPPKHGCYVLWSGSLQGETLNRRFRGRAKKCD